MFQYKEGECSRCGDVKKIVKNSPSGKYCYRCNEKRKEEKKGPKKKSGLKRNPTGEAEVFKEIWSERRRVSFISKEPLGNEARTWYFAHVIPKGKYPAFRLYKKNIVLLTFKEHEIWDNASKRKDVEDDPRWKKIFDLERELIDEYVKLYDT